MALLSCVDEKFVQYFQLVISLYLAHFHSFSRFLRNAGKHAITDSIGDMYMGVAVALIAAATGALSYIIVRIIGQQNEPPL